MLLEWSQESLLHGPGGFAPEGGGKQAEHGCVGNGSRSGCQDGGSRCGWSSGYAGRRKDRSSVNIRGGEEGLASRRAHWEDE